MTETFTRWDAAEHLATEADMKLYLEECATTGDSRLIAAALGDIARARNMTALAKEIGISRKGLYKALSGESNPTLDTVVKTAAALGLRLKFEAA